MACMDTAIPHNPANERNCDGLISVIVPVFKAENTIDKCVSSILEQTYGELELILVEDGSPDKSGQLCDAWSLRDSRIRVIHKPNGGQSSARNRGLEQARGAYIAFVDADDWIAPDCLSYLLSLYTADKGCHVTACNHMILRNGGAALASDIRQPICVLTRAEAFVNVLFHGCIDVSPWAKLYRKEIFDCLRFPEGRLFEDTWLFGDILNRTETVIFGNRACYNYVIHEGSTVNQAYRIEYLQYIDAARKLASDAAPWDIDGVGGVRRINHARLSVLRYMEHCKDADRPTRDMLRRQILADAPKYIRDPRTPRRDRIAVYLLRLGLCAFYAGWRMYSRLRP